MTGSCERPEVSENAREVPVASVDLIVRARHSRGNPVAIAAQSSKRFPVAISLRQLEYFAVLSEELHFGRAAERLGMSQPPLSLSIKQLEKDLGFSLMDRAGKPVRLTQAGAIFAEHAKRILGLLDSAKAISAQAATGFAGEVSIAFVSAMLYRRFPVALKAFQEAYPGIRLILREMNTTKQIEAVQTGEIDLGFIHSVQVPDTVTQHVLETERLVCCLPRDHRLAGRGRIKLPELAGERVIVFSREHAISFHDRIISSLANAGVTVEPDFHIQHWPTVVTLVAQGLGVSLVPKSLATLINDRVHYIEVDEPRAELEIALIHGTQPLSSTARLFIQHYNGDTW